MTYAGSLSSTSTVRHLSHSQEAGLAVVASEDPADEINLLLYEDVFLQLANALSLPTFELGGSSYAGLGRFTFFDAAGNRVFAIIEADPDSGLVVGQGVAVWDLQ